MSQTLARAKPMSVLKSKRGESSAQFLDTARESEIYTLRQCVKFPKRYTFFITNHIVSLAVETYSHVKAANSIFVTNEIELQLRRNHLIEANCNLQCLISQLDITKELFAQEIDSKVWIKWCELIHTEAKLISALKRSDVNRFKGKSSLDDD